MPRSLPVELNRRRLHAVEVPETFTANRSFTIDLKNHGEAVHVHLHLDDNLSKVARLETGNHYVEGGTTESVAIDIAAVDSPVTGKLKIVTGYGAEAEYVDVTVESVNNTQKSPVEVDEDLAKPPKREPDSTPLGEQVWASLPGLQGFLVLLLAVAALAIATATALYVNSSAALLGVGVVIGGVVAALFFMTR